MLRVGVLVLHAIVELSVAMLMWARPEAFFAAPDEELRALARSFGVGAGAVGVLSLLLVRLHRGDAGLVGALTLAAYQAGICVAQVITPMPGVPPWVPPLFHGGFVAAFLTLARAARRGTPDRGGAA